MSGHPSQDTVAIVFDHERWVVIVFENGNQQQVEFYAEESANSFAEGQRIRLGAPR